MEVKILKKEQSTVELLIVATPEDLKEYEGQALKKLAKGLSLSGFRPGKAPEAMVRKNVDPQKLIEETAQAAVPALYAKAVLDNKIDAIGSPKVEITKIAAGNDLEFRATVAILPEFKLPDFKGMRVEHKVEKIDDQKVERMVRMFQRDRATEKPVKRAAQKGDAVEIDFNIMQNKVPLEHGQGSKHPLIIGDGMFVPGFEDELVGLKADEEKDFSITFPKEYNKKDLAGKPAEVHVKMISIKERIIPDLTDDFVKGLGKFTDVADFKKRIRENLEQEAKGKEQERYEGEVLSKLADKIDLEIPDVLLQGELDKMSKELEQSLTSQGANFQDYLTSINKSLDELKKGWVEQAKKRVKTGLLLRRISKEEKIEVGDQELEKEINATLKQNPGNKEVEKTVKSKPYQDYVKEVVRNRKTIKLVSLYAEGRAPNSTDSKDK